MGLFTKDEMAKIEKAAKKSKKQGAFKKQSAKIASRGTQEELDRISDEVERYFADSPAILITSVEELHNYIDKCIEAGYCAIDTETTGLDRVNDTIVGFSLYYPGGVECYIPNNHLIFRWDEPYKDQISYEDSGKELQRLVDANVKVVFANADYDIAMIYKDFKVDLCDVCYYDVILAWRCLKENEPRNGLKELYTKYVLKGKGDPKRFSDFFTPALFPYCKPSVAKLYAANDAKITYDLFKWQLPYTIPSNPKCQKAHLERIADIIWNLEFPMIKVCAMMHRTGMYFDNYVASHVADRYHKAYNEELRDLRMMVQDLIDDKDTPNNSKRPFKTGKDFIPTSPKHVSYLIYDLMGLPKVGNGSTDKGILRDFALPQTDAILHIRSLSVLINTFVDKLTDISGECDGRVHGQFKSVGAGTGRMSCIARGTKVSMPYVSKNIEDVEVGDVVYCFDVVENKLKTSIVTASQHTGIKRCVLLTLRNVDKKEGTKSLLCTPEHNVRTVSHNWVRADMSKGRVILGIDGQYKVESVTQLDNKLDVYDISVEGEHNFIASGICVHNSSDPNMQNIPSHASDIRHMFRATAASDEIVSIDDTLELKGYDSVETPDGYREVMLLSVGDSISTDEGSMVISSMSKDVDDYVIGFGYMIERSRVES